MSDYKIETKCIQSGWEPKKGEPRVVPVYQSTTFKYDTSDQMGRLFDLEDAGYFYTRLQNPTNDSVAAKICDLSGGNAHFFRTGGQLLCHHEYRGVGRPYHLYNGSIWGDL